MNKVVIIFFNTVLTFLISVSGITAQSCTCNNYGTEIVYNGDFSLGNTGFTSNYNYSFTAGSGKYGISSTPWVANAFWSHCSDHTTGTGNLMWVDCSDTGTLDIWTQIVPGIGLNTDYILTCWITNLDLNGPSTLEFLINGQVIGNPLTAPLTTCNWVEFCFIWNSGNEDSAIITIRNQSQFGVGNDVGIDDISLKACCPLSVKDVTAAICIGDGYLLPGGNLVYAGGIYNDTLNTFFGCDSIINTQLTVLATSSYLQNISICSGQSFFAGGAFQTVSGTYYDTLVNMPGCDSFLTTILSVLPNSAFTINPAICEGQSYFAGGGFQTTPGTYTDNLVNYLGCDSILTTNLTVLPNSTFSVSISICQGDSYFAGGALQTTTGNYYDTLVNYLGCDSVIITNLTVLTNSPVTVNISICDGQSYFAQGFFQTTTGTYLDTFVNYLGCDSLITTNLTVLANTSFLRNISICDGQSFYAGGDFQTQSGVYADTILNTAGCDSIITTNLTVIPNTAFTQNISICSGDSILLGSAWQTQSGSYIDHYINELGCDSILTTILYVIPPIATPVAAVICSGETYFAAGANQSQSGNYIDTFIATSACDSIVTTNLTVLAPISTDVFTSICDGEQYFAGGNWQNIAGIYFDTLFSYMSCDSEVVTHLIVYPAPQVDLGNDTALCEGSSVMLYAGSGFQDYLWQDQSDQPSFVADDSGSYWVLVTNSSGCTAYDTLLVTSIYPLPDHFLPPDTFICGNIPLTIQVPDFNKYLWNDGDTNNFQVFTQEGIYSLEVHDIYGCSGSDSVSIVNACDKDILVPNAFTPNNDGTNDIFLPVIIKNLVSYHMIIFNRWGRKVFESVDSSVGWNGFEYDLPGEIGAYYWSVEYTVAGSAKNSIHGNVTLLR
ncbi:MAG: gliding motility-associated C-terminal domain-containing protein [Chitinophagales bacterium]